MTKFVLLVCLAATLFLGIQSRDAGFATHSTDIQALKQLKASIDPASIPSTACLASWDFRVDPCQSRSTSLFICGLRCEVFGDASNKMRRLRVTEITLDNAGYRGMLSPYLGNLTALQVLDLSGNVFQGAIPASLGHLSSLLKLDLSGNRISQRIPDSIGMLSRLQYLSLANNALVGAIPTSLNRLSSLEKLLLFRNSLTDEIPPMNTMVSLLYFDGSNNLFSGWLPALLPPSLMELSLRMNRIQGRLPKSMTGLKELEVLDLSHNLLNGPVDAGLFVLPSLQQLNLANNNFDALVAIAESEQVAADSQLVEIDLSYNQLQGTLPVFFVRMRKVTALSLGHNRFSGRIPIEYALKSVAMLFGAEPLMRLYLDSNFLVGELPSPFLSILPGQLAASFVGNCLRSCPMQLFFCQGGRQRPSSECRNYLMRYCFRCQPLKILGMTKDSATRAYARSTLVQRIEKKNTPVE